MISIVFGVATFVGSMVLLGMANLDAFWLQTIIAGLLDLAVTRK